MTEKALKRRELIRITEQFTEALIEKRPQDLPLAADVKATYNGRCVEVGQNEVWQDALIIKERQTFVDPVTGQSVFFGVVSNETVDHNEDFQIANHFFAKYYHYTVRLKVTDGKICEIEECGQDQRMRFFHAGNDEIHLPDLEFEIPVPEEERSSREELAAIVDAYWDALDRKGNWQELPIHPDAQRIENGYRTTNHSRSFRGDFKHNPGFRWPSPEGTRQYPVIDPVRGVVVSYCLLEGGSNVQDGGRGVYIVEAFKIKDGAICHLMAHFPRLWETTGWEK